MAAGTRVLRTTPAALPGGPTPGGSFLGYLVGARGPNPGRSALPEVVLPQLLLYGLAHGPGGGLGVGRQG